ncbi:hypothetical protein [Paracoccus sediminilitoris]|uniref:hypothetical protein n=1 Tax=Paracoccus sediminilitoris TaxID=2202419 RepID=UPI001F39CBD2|nr:hypothetical protein [Paracoccus sediminilitoris]
MEATMSYDPNDPNRPKPGTPDHKETYVEPVERKSSALPLIIGVLLALALAYFVLQRFMTDDTVTVEGDTTTVTTTENADPTEPEAPAVVTEPVAEPESDAAAVETEAEAEADQAAADAEAAADDAAAAADDAAEDAGAAAETATEDAAAAAESAAESAADAAEASAEATGNAVDNAVDSAGETAANAANEAAEAAQDAADALDDAITVEEEPAVTPEADVEADTTTAPAN